MEHVTKSSAERSQGRPSAEQVSQPTSAESFVDNRPGTATQRRLAAAIDNSPRKVTQQTQLRSMFGEAVQLNDDDIETQWGEKKTDLFVPREEALTDEDIASAWEGSESESEIVSHDLALAVMTDFYNAEVEYAFRGLGGGGAKWYRKPDVKALRADLKQNARKRVAGDVKVAAQERSLDDVGPATAAYQQMIGETMSRELVKPSIDRTIRSVAEQIVDQRLFILIYQDAKLAAKTALGEDPYNNRAAARSAAKAEAARHIEGIHARVTAAKNKITGKGGATVDPEKRGKLRKDVRKQVTKDRVGEYALQQAIRAPSMSAGLATLETIVDNVVPNPGESASLKIEFTIPAGPGGVVVVIGMNATAARGINGATTSGVTTLGDPNRVELAAEFSVGVGAEWVGIKAAGAVKFFIRSGSDQGTEAALHAMSYAAYRTASKYSDGLANLWAPKGLDGKRSVERAETWAAMMEETLFAKHKEAFADTGIGVDLGVDVRLAAAELGVGLGASRFTRYDAESLIAALDDRDSDRASRFGKTLPSAHTRGEAEHKRNLGKYVAKKQALRGNFAVKVGIGSQSVGFAASLSGPNLKNLGAEITADIGMPAGASSPTVVDSILNGWVTGVGELLKKMHTAVAKQESDDRSGGVGLALQVPTDVATVFDAGMAHQVREAIASISQATVVKGPSATAVGTEPPTGAGALERVTGAAVSSKLQFALALGLSDGNVVARFELRSVRSFSVGAPSAVKVEGTKTSRLFAVGLDGTDGAVIEVLGKRFDNSGGQ